MPTTPEVKKSGRNRMQSLMNWGRIIETVIWRRLKYVLIYCYVKISELLLVSCKFYGKYLFIFYMWEVGCTFITHGGMVRRTECFVYCGTRFSIMIVSAREVAGSNLRQGTIS